MAILIKCDCGNSYFAGVGTMHIEQTGKEINIVCICPGCKEKQIARGIKIEKKDRVKR